MYRAIFLENFFEVEHGNCKMLLCQLGHTRIAVTQLELLRTAYINIWYALYKSEFLRREQYHQNRRLVAELDTQLPRLYPNVNPLEALRVIRDFCAATEKLHPILLELEIKIPDRLVQEVATLADLAEPIARAGGSCPNEGSRR